MKFDIITIFPNIFDSYLKESILGRSQKQGLIEIKTHNLRDYATDKHHSTDDSPYGGGLGMVMMVEPIYKALQSLPLLEGEVGGGVADKRQTALNGGTTPNPSSKRRGTCVILLSPRGERFTQKKAKDLTKYSQLIFVCGRYEGVDERVAEFVDETISIGDYVLNGGELGSMVIVEAVSRLLPGVLGKDESSAEESFSDDNSTEYPHYTRPEVFTTDDGKELKVPEILLSGHHAEIKKWRKSKRKWRRRLFMLYFTYVQPANDQIYQC